MDKYQVIGALVTDIPVGTPDGPMRTTLYQDAILPAGVPAERIAHLLDVKLIKKVGGDEPEAAEPEPTPTGVNSRSNKGDLVEHGVAQGDDRAELEKLTRDDLLAKYVRQQ